MMSFAYYFVQQAIWQAPLLIVYVAGIVVCAVRARRAPLAATLAIVGLGLMLLASLVVPLVQAVAIQRLNAGGGFWRSMMQVVAFAGSVVRAAGVGLLVGAVFAGRSREVSGGFEVPVATRAPGA